MPYVEGYRRSDGTPVEGYYRRFAKYDFEERRKRSPEEIRNDYQRLNREDAKYNKLIANKSVPESRKEEYRSTSAHIMFEQGANLAAYQIQTGKDLDSRRKLRTK